jgi:hypothetical protein
VFAGFPEVHWSMPKRESQLSEMLRWSKHDRRCCACGALTGPPRPLPKAGGIGAENQTAGFALCRRCHEKVTTLHRDPDSAAGECHPQGDQSRNPLGTSKANSDVGYSLECAAGTSQETPARLPPPC